MNKKSIIGLILFFTVLAFMYWVVTNAWKPKIRYIDGHQYIQVPEIDGVEIEHHPNCSKCKNNE